MIKTINIDITNHCNKKCDFCPMKDRYTNDMMPLGYMSFDLYKKIVDQFQGDEINLFKDGEPLMHPDLKEMLIYARNKGFFTHIATNGILLNSKKYDLIDNLDLLTISEYDELPDFQEFLEEKGNRLPDTQLKVFSDKKYDLSIKQIKGIKHYWTDSTRGTRTPCSRLLDACAVTWDGWYTICCVDYKRDIKLHNLNHVPLREAMKLNEVLYAGQEKGVFIAPCKNCNYWEERKNINRGKACLL